MRNKMVFMLLTLVTVVYAASGFTISQKVYVTVNKLNYRSTPTLKGKLEGQFRLADELTIVKKGAKKEHVAGKDDYWYQVKKDGRTGWVFGSFLTDQKVAGKKELAKKLSRTYYYYELKKKNNYTRILKITDTTYQERMYSNSSGITDEITGDVVYQADTIILVPKKRKVRPSTYIDYPQDNVENQAYANAYTSWTDDPAYLKSLPRFKPAQKMIKLFVKYEGQGTIYLLEKDADIAKTKYGYTTP